MKITLEIPQFDIIIEQQKELIEILKNKNTGNDIFLSANQVADLLHISYSQVVTMARNGKLPGKKIGTLWRFSRNIISEWINANG